MITYRVTMDVDVPDHWTNAMVQDEISDALDEGMTDEVSEFRIRYVIAPSGLPMMGRAPKKGGTL